MVTSRDVKKNLTRGDAWLRVFFIVVFAFVYSVVGWVLGAVVLLQVCWSLITANTSQRLRTFGASLAEFLRQIVRFITYNSDEMPFPFADWPESGKPEAGKPESDRSKPDAPKSDEPQSAEPKPSKPKVAKKAAKKAAKSKATKSKAAKPEPDKPEPNKEE